MHHLKWILTVFFLISYSAAFASSNLAANYQSSEVIAAIEANYSQIQTISGRINQTRSYKNNKIDSELSFFFKNPDKLYLDFLTPLRQIIIINGTSCYGYSPEDNQAEQIDLTGINMAFSPVKLLGIDILDELKEAFNLTVKKNEAKNITILASPKTGGRIIAQILIDVDPSRWVISSFNIMDKKGKLISQTLFKDYQQVSNIWFPLRIESKSLLEKQVITESISFHRLRLNPEIPDERFQR